MCAQALDGKVVVVVGGTSGLGRSGVEACLEAGARVVAVGRSLEKVEAVNGLGSEVFGQVGDAAEPGCAEAAIDEAESRFGGFDGLYHVAGGSGRSAGDGPLHELTDEGIDYTLRLNLFSVIYSNRAAARRLSKSRRRGSVLNMSSVLAFAPAGAHFATHAYAAAKAGIIGLTRSAASKYAACDIRFNAIAPALVETPMSERAQESPKILEYTRRRQPLDGGRIGQARDADGAVVYFLSDQSAFVTGQVVSIDGGWEVSDGQ
ncbi:MAG: SDR family oxidoreductase [Planctomycetota bacterium]|nr:SDR family oxidoreductase [Planctomycetota bacterium]